MAQEQAAVKPSVFERHLQTGIQIILVALLGWAGVELVNLGKASVVLQERLVHQGQQLADMRAELREWSEVYYRQADARRELDAIESRINALDERVSALETRR